VALKAVVVGGTGFIGSHLVQGLIGQGCDVRVPVRATSDRELLAEVPCEIREVRFDHTGGLTVLMDGVDTVFHLASVRGAGWSYNDEEIYEANVGLTKSLLEAATLSGVRHFIYVSSVSVYGHPWGGPVHEGMPPDPATRYGRTKLESESLVRKYHEERGLGVTIVQPVITYGPRDTWGMVPKLVRLIRGRKYLTVGNGENRVHLIYIDDLVRGLLLVMNRSADTLDTFILAGPTPIRINDLVRSVSSLVDVRVPGWHAPLGLATAAARILEAVYETFRLRREPFLTRDKLDIMCRDRYFSSHRARKELGFVPTVEYAEGLAQTVSWLASSGNL